MTDSLRQYWGVCLLLAAIAGAATACGSSADEDVALATPTGQAANTRQAEHSRSLVLENRTAAIGDSVTVSGDGWQGTGPVTLYLATEEQLDSGIYLRSKDSLALLGEIQPSDGGSFALEFELFESYETANGQQLEVEESQPLFLFARQTREGGSSGSTTGPLTVE